MSSDRRYISLFPLWHCPSPSDQRMNDKAKPAQTLDDIELVPDAMAVTERAIKAAFRTDHVSADKVKKAVATKRRKAKRATRP